MKTLIAITILWGAVLVDSATMEEPVYFPDAKLKAALEDELWISNPTPYNLLGLTSLNASAMGITDLTGLEYALNLQTLVLSYNHIHDISPLSGLSSLQTLDMNNNAIKDLSALSGLNSLECLNIHNNGFHDISPLSGLSHLQTLILYQNQISDISPLSGLSHLQTLYLSNNRISDISVLSGLTSLQTLWLDNNLLSDLSALASLSHLQELDLHENMISDISVLSALSDLQSLDLSSNQIVELSVLAGLSSLQTLQLDNNGIVDISPLCKLTSLAYLHILQNPLNPQACELVPQIIANNPGIRVYHPCTLPHLSTSSSEGGSVINPGEGEFTYEYGTNIFLIAKADPFFVFTHWSGSISGCTQNPLYLFMDQDHEIRAHFRSLLNILYVDEDAPGDPAPADPNEGDLQENGSPDHPFDSIQKAIDVAADNASIVVRPGTYYEDIDLLGKPILLTSFDPNDSSVLTAYPVLSGTGTGPVVRFASGEDPNCRLSGFVISQPKSLLPCVLYLSKSSPTIDHCLIVGNRSAASNGAAVLCTDSQAVLDCCTIVDNQGGQQGASLVLVDSNVVLTNSIVWDNAPKEILSMGTSQPSITYTNVSGGYSGEGNLNTDPLFAQPGYWINAADPNQVLSPTDPCAVWIGGNYHLQSQGGRWDEKTGARVQDDVTSPCIDAGDPTCPIGQEPSPCGETVNLGAYGGTPLASQSCSDPVPQ
jgi:hypothetical protein